MGALRSAAVKQRRRSSVADSPSRQLTKGTGRLLQPPTSSKALGGEYKSSKLGASGEEEGNIHTFRADSRALDAQVGNCTSFPRTRILAH